MSSFPGQFYLIPMTKCWLILWILSTWLFVSQNIKIALWKSCDHERFWNSFWNWSKNILSSDHGSRLLFYLRDGKINGMVGILLSWIEWFLIIQLAAWAYDFRNFSGPIREWEFEGWHNLKVILNELSWEWGDCKDSWTLDYWIWVDLPFWE